MCGWMCVGVCVCGCVGWWVDGLVGGWVGVCGAGGGGQRAAPAHVHPLASRISHLACSPLASRALRTRCAARAASITSLLALLAPRMAHCTRSHTLQASSLGSSYTSSKCENSPSHHHRIPHRWNLRFIRTAIHPWYPCLIHAPSGASRGIRGGSRPRRSGARIDIAAWIASVMYFVSHSSPCLRASSSHITGLPHSPLYHGGGSLQTMPLEISNAAQTENLFQQKVRRWCGLCVL